MEEGKQPNKVFWTKSKIVVAIAIVTSWAPFYGYTYLNGYVAGAGFEADYINLPIQEAVYYFLIGISDIWGSDIFFHEIYRYIAIELGIFTFLITVYLLRVDYTNDRLKKFKIKRDKILESIKSNWYSTIAFSVATSVFVGGVVLVMPIILWGSLAIVFLFAILGNPIGINNGKDALIENICIYGKPGSDCNILRIGSDRLIGYSLYMNDKYIYFISSKGRYQSTLKGEVVMYKPFSLNFKINAPDTIKFNNKEWENNISSRAGMLEDFWSTKLEGITGEHILKQLGTSDDYFHYDEFPAYKLSDKTDCKIAFPVDWVSGKVVNVVFSGNCKGII